MELCVELNTVDSVGHIARVRGVVRARTSPKGHLRTSAREGEGKASVKALLYPEYSCPPESVYRSRHS